MAVILKDMTIPTHCMWCDFGQRWDNQSTVCCRKPYEPPVLDDVQGRPDYCPLEEIEDRKAGTIITNKEWLSTLSAEEWWDKVQWLLNEYGMRWDNTRLGVIGWLEEEHENAEENNIKEYEDESIEGEKHHEH